MSAPRVPEPGPSCICCTNHGLLPAATLNNQPVGQPGLVDRATIAKCCDQCIHALFLGGIHPHAISPLLGGMR